MNRWFVVIGLALVLAGLAWPWLSRLPLGRLPGDFHIHRDGFDFYLPLGTSVVISVVLTALAWVLRR